jgi:hypothetical protein
LVVAVSDYALALNEAELAYLRALVVKDIERRGKTALADALAAILAGALSLSELRTMAALGNRERRAVSRLDLPSLRRYLVSVTSFPAACARCGQKRYPVTPSPRKWLQR